MCFAASAVMILLNTKCLANDHKHFPKKLQQFVCTVAPTGMCLGVCAAAIGDVFNNSAGGIGNKNHNILIHAGNCVVSVIAKGQFLTVDNQNDVIHLVLVVRNEFELEFLAGFNADEGAFFNGITVTGWNERVPEHK